MDFSVYLENLLFIRTTHTTTARTAATSVENHVYGMGKSIVFIP